MKKSEKTLRQLFRLVCFRPGYFSLMLVCWIICHWEAYMLGLVTREFFNTLTGEAGISAQFGLSGWTLILLILVVELLGNFFGVVWFASQFIFFYTIKFLIKQNLFRWILEGPIKHHPILP